MFQRIVEAFNRPYMERTWWDSVIMDFSVTAAILFAVFVVCVFYTAAVYLKDLWDGRKK